MAAPLRKHVNFVARSISQNRSYSWRVFKNESSSMKITQRRLVHSIMLDENVRDVLDHVKYKKHPGVMQTNVVRLPDVLQDNIRAFLRTQTIREIDDQASSMSNYLRFRKRPIETGELRLAARRIHAKLGLPDIDDDYTSQENVKDKKKAVRKLKLELKQQLYHWKPIK